MQIFHFNKHDFNDMIQTIGALDLNFIAAYNDRGYLLSTCISKQRVDFSNIEF